MSTSDGKNPKFRVLCKCCNSYRHTVVLPCERIDGPAIQIICTKCGNNADSFEEEFDDR